VSRASRCAMQNAHRDAATRYSTRDASSRFWKKSFRRQITCIERTRSCNLAKLLGVRINFLLSISSLDHATIDREPPSGSRSPINDGSPYRLKCCAEKFGESSSKKSKKLIRTADTYVRPKACGSEKRRRAVVDFPDTPLLLSVFPFARTNRRGSASGRHRAGKQSPARDKTRERVGLGSATTFLSAVTTRRRKESRDRSSDRKFVVTGSSRGHSDDGSRLLPRKFGLEPRASASLPRRSTL